MIPSAVFDTVVLLQAGGKPDGPAGACLQLVMEDQVVLHLSAAGLAELEDVLHRDRTRRKFPLLTDEHIATFLRGLRARAVIAEAIPIVFQYPRDPDDEHILNLAIASGIRFLVTRDNDLLDLMDDENADGRAYRQHCPELTILNPVAFLVAARPPSEPRE